MLMLFPRVKLSMERCRQPRKQQKSRCYYRLLGSGRELFMYRQQFRKWKEVKVDECRGD